MWKQHGGGSEIGLYTSKPPFDPSLPSLLCVHGAGGSGRLFRAQLSGLARMANVAALDLPGHGQTTGDAMGSIGEYAGWVADFIRKGPVRPILLGHSMGGAIAQTVALNEPGLLSGLVLAASGAKLRVSPKLLEGVRNDYPQACSDLVSMAYGPEASPALLRQAKEQLLATPPQTVLADFVACDHFDERERLAQIELPTLVVVGTKDLMTPPKYAEHLTSSLKKASLLIIEGAGHSLYLEAPNAFNRAVGEFLRNLA